MLENCRILQLEPSASCPSELFEQLAPLLTTVNHVTINNQQELEHILATQNWDALIQRDSSSSSDSLQAFFANLPGMACQMSLDNQAELSFNFVSSGCMALFGFSPEAIQQQSACILDMLHPDDRSTFFKRMNNSAKHTIPWNWEGRFVLPPNNEIKWVNLRATPRRTASSLTVWEGFLVNITQNKQAEIEIKQSRQRLRELSSHIERIKEQERMRIAREIHDEIGVLLTALKMDLAWLTQRLPNGSQALLEKAQTMSDLLNTAGKAANDLVHSLRPGFLDYFGIVAAIEVEAREFSKRTGTPCHVHKSDENIELCGEQSITLFRVFQETLNNIMKHAQAKQVTVSLEKQTSTIALTVSDDGKGFDDNCRNKPRSFGLRGIQERIEHLGGTVEISSRLGQGTRIAVTIPLEKNNNEQTEQR